MHKIIKTESYPWDFVQSFLQSVYAKQKTIFILILSSQNTCSCQSKRKYMKFSW